VTAGEHEILPEFVIAGFNSTCCSRRSVPSTPRSGCWRGSGHAVTTSRLRATSSGRPASGLARDAAGASWSGPATTCSRPRRCCRAPATPPASSRPATCVRRGRAQPSAHSARLALPQRSCRLRHGGRRGRTRASLAPDEPIAYEPLGLALMRLAASRRRSTLGRPRPSRARKPDLAFEPGQDSRRARTPRRRERIDRRGIRLDRDNPKYWHDRATFLSFRSAGTTPFATTGRRCGSPAACRMTRPPSRAPRRT